MLFVVSVRLSSCNSRNGGWVDSQGPRNARSRLSWDSLSYHLQNLRAQGHASSMIIDGWIHCFKMAGIHAARLIASVIDFFAVRDSTVLALIKSTMSERLPAIDRNASVPSVIGIPLPNPTGRFVSSIFFHVFNNRIGQRCGVALAGAMQTFMCCRYSDIECVSADCTRQRRALVSAWNRRSSSGNTKAFGTAIAACGTSWTKVVRVSSSARFTAEECIRFGLAVLCQVFTPLCRASLRGGARSEKPFVSRAITPTLALFDCSPNYSKVGAH